MIRNKILLLIIWMLLSSIVLNADRLNDIKERGYVIVGVEKNFEPFSFLSRKGKRIGFDIDIIESVAKELNIKIRYKPTEFSNLLPFIKNGTIDISIAAMMHKKERDEGVDFSITYLYDGQTIMVPKASKLQNYKDFAGKKIGGLEGHGSGKVFKVLQSNSQVSYFKNTDDLITALKNNTIDGVTSDYTFLLNIAKKSKGKLKIIGRKLTSQPYAIAMPENESNLRDEINFAIQATVKNGEYKKIHKKWFKVGANMNPTLWP